MTDAVSIETKLAAARTRLILDQPFLGSLVMHLPLTAVDKARCKTTATDARAFYYNADYIAGLTLEQTQFVLAHEAMHCALSHFSRRNHRDRRRWDIACDYAVNMILDAENMRGPVNALTDAKYRGLTAEEIYPILHQDSEEQPMDDHLFEGEGQGDTSGSVTQPPSPPESGAGGEGAGDSGASASPPQHIDMQALEQQWQSRLATAAQSARQSGKLSISMQRMVDELIAPQLSWRAMLAQYLVQAARDDYSFQRPSRREADAMLPRLYSQGLNLVVAIDTSGSIQNDELREFLSEIDAIKGQVRAEIDLLACDERLAPGAPWHFSSWEPMQLPVGLPGGGGVTAPLSAMPTSPRGGVSTSLGLPGGGGTDFRPVFDWVEKCHAQPDVLLYFTDAEGPFPKVVPSYPVIWLVKGRAPVPFGIRVALN